MLLEFATLLGVIGCIFVSLDKPILANFVWLIGNPIILFHNLKVGEMEQARMWFVYSVIVMLGLYRNRDIILNRIRRIK